MKNLNLQIAKVLNLSVKKVITFPGHDGKIGIDAKLFMDTKYYAHAYDDARGGGINIKANYPNVSNKEVADLDKKIQEEYPEYNLMEDHKGPDLIVKHDLESVVDSLVNQFLLEKEKKKNEKKGIDLGDSIIVFDKVTIPTFLKKYDKKKALKTIQKAYDECKSNNKEVLNKEYLKNIGIRL
eukprot:TRINITY_DN7798_c3_g1_i1.p1 TRINITY_DN7798_c3_g1~~TRINITY_DN7798_c3_g1_i1.p1  ORF type:complete len:182 (+),score=36.17 TRINITY_DN7798_c3_g1_i1:67-612(+)